jgi:hypothetical protein
MKGTAMTEYTFNVSGSVTVTMEGTDTDDNYEAAMKEAVEQAKAEIDGDWVTDCTAPEEYTDYEDAKEA